MFALILAIVAILSLATLMTFLIREASKPVSDATIARFMNAETASRALDGYATGHTCSPTCTAHII